MLLLKLKMLLQSLAMPLVLFMMILLTVSGCRNDQLVSDSYCLIYEPIIYQASDTVATKEAILEQNAQFFCVCEKDCQ